MSPLPPSVKRSSVRTSQRKESAILDNWEILSEIEAGLLSTATMEDYVAAAETVGLVVHRTIDPRAVVLLDDRNRAAGVLIEHDHEVIVCPSPQAPSRLHR